MTDSSAASNYCGFYLEKLAGNNAFSFSSRTIKKIFVPALKEGTSHDVFPGEEIVFCEIKDGKECPCTGLKNFIYWNHNNQPVFFFDNHNHAFFFWLFSLNKKYIPQGLSLVHVDQHKDMRFPSELLSAIDAKDMSRVFTYTQEQLNVGNFIVPALHLGIFSEIIDVSTLAAFEKNLPEEFVLDIDLDVFAEEMSYIEEDVKKDYLKNAIKKASMITVATSPYFMDQHKAVGLIRELFDE